MNANRILVLNQGLKDYVVDMGGDTNKVSIVSSGVDLEKFNPKVDGSLIEGNMELQKMILYYFLWDGFTSFQV